MAEITTLVNFNFANAEHPVGSLVEDAAGNLFGTAASDYGESEQVFEIAKTANGYASAPTILATFSDSSFQSSGLTIDAAGDLFAQTNASGGNTDIYEIAKSGGGYAAPSLIANVSGAPSGSLVIDGYGDLVGANVTQVYEIRPIGTNYSTSPVTIASIPTLMVGGNSYNPVSAIITADSAGDLFLGVTGSHYAFRFLTYAAGVFEIAKTSTGYASQPQLTAIVTSDGFAELNSLVVDGAGNVFGDLSAGGPNGSLFELPKTDDSYATSPTFLPAPANAYGETGNIALDPGGNLFAETDDTVFAEILSQSGTYSEYSLGVFGAPAGSRLSSVILGFDGSLYGITQSGGAHKDGALFKIALPSLTVTSVSVAPATAQLTISGILDIPDPNRPVSIYRGDDLLGTATAAANGAWSATLAQTIASGESLLDAAASNTYNQTTSVAVDLFYSTNNQWGATSGGNGAVYLDNAQVSVIAGGASVYLVGAGDCVSLYNTSGDWDTVTGDDGSVILTGAQAAIAGGGDQIYFNGQSASAVSLHNTEGNWDKATGDGASLTLVNAEVSVFGGYETIYFDGSADDAASLYATNGHWNNVYGDDGMVTLNNAQASVFGEDDHIYFSPGTSNQVALYNTHGVADAVVGSNGVVILTGAQSSVSGGSNVLYFTGQDDAADLYATSSGWDNVNATGGGVTLHGAQASMFGGGNTIHFDGSSADAASLYNTGGSWDTVFGDDGAVTLNGAQASLLGHGDYVYFSAGVHNAVSLYWTYGVDDHVFGSSGSINLAGAQADVHGDRDYLYLTGASTAAMTGSNENFVFQAAIGQATIGGFVSSDIIQFSSADFANWQALSGHISQSGDDAVITYDAKDSVTLTNYSASSLTAANFKFA